MRDPAWYDEPYELKLPIKVGRMYDFKVKNGVETYADMFVKNMFVVVMGKTGRQDELDVTVDKILDDAADGHMYSEEAEGFAYIHSTVSRHNFFIIVNLLKSTQHPNDQFWPMEETLRRYELYLSQPLQIDHQLKLIGE